MNNEIKMCFLSKRCNIAIVRNMIATMLVEANPTITFINELKTVVSEAVTNAIVHGYDNQEDKYINLNIIINNEFVSVDIIDKGIGIEDIAEARTPLFSTKATEERSGLGFTIIEMFTDKLEITSKLGKGTAIHLEKKW